MYKAVLFDMFGTLIPSPPTDSYNVMVGGLARILGKPVETFKEPWMAINDGRLDGSFGSSEGDIHAVAELVSVEVSESQMALCMELRRSATRKFLTPKVGTIEMLDDLLGMGSALGLVTDCVFDVPAIWPETPFASYFSAMYFSCVTHVRKPDSRAYLGVLETIGISPSEALFVGDGGSDELNGATRAEIDALMIDDVDGSGAELLRVGLVEWGGPSVKNMSDITRYVRESS